MVEKNYRKLDIGEGRYAILDNEDFDDVSLFRWHWNGSSEQGYARRSTWNKEQGEFHTLHRFILQDEICEYAEKYSIENKQVVVNFKNGNSLNCRKENMKLTTRKNSSQDYIRSKHKSYFKDSKTGNFRITLSHQGKKIFYATVSTEEEAKNVINHFAETKPELRLKKREVSVKIHFEEINFITQKESSTGFKGVYKKRESLYDAKIKVKGKGIFIKSGKTALEAAFYYDEYIDKNNLDPSRKNNLTEKQVSSIDFSHKGTSKYKGVSFIKSKNKWEASIIVEGKSTFLGHFTHEVNGAKAYNDYVIENNIDRKLNSLDDIDFSKYIEPVKNKASKYYGVSYTPNYTKKWRVQFQVNKKTFLVGRFETELEAGKRANEFIIENKLNKKLNELD